MVKNKDLIPFSSLRTTSHDKYYRRGAREGAQGMIPQVMVGDYKLKNPRGKEPLFLFGDEKPFGHFYEV